MCSRAGIRTREQMNHSHTAAGLCRIYTGLPPLTKPHVAAPRTDIDLLLRQYNVQEQPRQSPSRRIQPACRIPAEAGERAGSQDTEGALVTHNEIRARCRWANGDPLMEAYHDEEWGVPVRDGKALWAKLTLDGFQAGLSWRTILHRREGFVRAFQGFDPERVAAFTEADIERLMADPGIIRSRAKIVAAVGNARAYLAMEEAGEDFAEFVWAFVGGRTIVNEAESAPAETPLSREISAALKRRGFKFVGPIIVYAWMQAVGLVDDHAPDCFRRSGAE